MKAKLNILDSTFSVEQNKQLPIPNTHLSITVHEFKDKTEAEICLSKINEVIISMNSRVKYSDMISLLDTFIVFHNELVVNGSHSDKDRELEYNSLKKEIEEKIGRDARNQRMIYAKEMEILELDEKINIQQQQIKQLKEELEITQKAFHECSTSEMSCRESLPLARKKIDELYAEIQSLKSQLEEHQHILMHFRCIKAGLVVTAKEAIDYHDNLKSKNEKLQKSIDEIRVWYGCNQDQVNSETAIKMIRII
jgi:hypothetical protein